jgi:hypothetical protein
VIQLPLARTASVILPRRARRKQALDMGSQGGTVAMRAKSISNLYALSLGQRRSRGTVSALAVALPRETFTPDDSTTPAHGHPFNGDTVFKTQKRVQTRYSTTNDSKNYPTKFQPPSNPHAAPHRPGQAWVGVIQ